MAKSTLNADARLARNLASTAGKLLLTLQRSGQLTGKSLGDAGDAVAHAFLVRALAEVRPDDGLLSEEGAADPSRLEKSRAWIVDPLDGTREYSEGRTDWAVHVALAIDGVATVGAVALPGLNLVLSTMGPEPLPAAADRPRMLVSRTRPSPDSVRVAEAIGANLVPMGSAGAKAMAVVRGEAEIYLHSGGMYEWDSCAPVAVARAHGLHVSRADGSPLVYNQSNPWMPDLLICRPEWADRVLEVVDPANQKPVKSVRSNRTTKASARSTLSAASSLRVSAIGSCRVYKPLRRATTQGHLASFSHMFPHVHNPSEIHQALRILKGEIDPPKELREWLNLKVTKTGKVKNTLNQFLDQSDVVVVELSSIRRIVHQTWDIQLNNFRDKLRAESFADSEIGDLHKDDLTSSMARTSISTRSHQSVTKAIVENASFSEMDADQITAGINAVREALPKPILFVGVVEKGPSGESISQRVLLNRCMSEFASRNSDAGFFNPTRLVEQFGFSKVMKDLGHYNEVFELSVGVALAEALAQLRADPMPKAEVA